MSERNHNALTAQNGACNPRPIVKALADAINDCYAESTSPTTDPAVFLLLHQLTYLLTSFDIACASDRLNRRWVEALTELEKKAVKA